MVARVAAAIRSGLNAQLLNTRLSVDDPNASPDEVADAVVREAEFAGSVDELDVDLVRYAEGKRRRPTQRPPAAVVRRYEQARALESRIRALDTWPEGWPFAGAANAAEVVDAATIIRQLDLLEEIVTKAELEARVMELESLIAPGLPLARRAAAPTATRRRKVVKKAAPSRREPPACEALLSRRDPRGVLHAYLVKAPPSQVAARHLGSVADPDGAASLLMKARRLLEPSDPSGAVVIVDGDRRVVKCSTWNPPVQVAKPAKRGRR